jgi:hypothetical protein
MEYQKLAHWFSQNYQWIFSGIGVLIVALLSQRFVSRNEAKHESRSTTKVDGSSLAHSPVATGQGIKQSVTTQTFHAENIHIGRAVAAPTPTQPSKSELAIPNFIYAGAKRKDVFVNPWPREGICDPITEDQRTKSIPAFVLKFENRVKAGRKISRALNVIAKLKFRHKEGATARDTDYGVWLNSPCNSTDMGMTSPSFCTTANERVYITTSSQMVARREP